ncbi:unnamed protein product [Lota lota]
MRGQEAGKERGVRAETPERNRIRMTARNGSGRASSAAAEIGPEPCRESRAELRCSDHDGADSARDLSHYPSRSHVSESLTLGPRHSEMGGAVLQPQFVRRSLLLHKQYAPTAERPPAAPAAIWSLTSSTESLIASKAVTSSPSHQDLCNPGKRGRERTKAMGLPLLDIDTKAGGSQC